MYEVRFHGRGGQGAVTAANILALAGFYDGKYVQAFPMFGVERRGAPVAAYLRMDDDPIEIKHQIYNPDAVVVLDSSLIEQIDVTSGLKENGILIINSGKEPSSYNVGNFRVYTTDATEIAIEHGLGTKTNPIVNTAILGAYCRVVGNISMESLEKAVVSLSPIKKDENRKSTIDAYNKVKGV